jgi:hypothetical protein
VPGTHRITTVLGLAAVLAGTGAVGLATGTPAEAEPIVVRVDVAASGAADASRESLLARATREADRLAAERAAKLEAARKAKAEAERAAKAEAARKAKAEAARKAKLAAERKARAAAGSRSSVRSVAPSSGSTREIGRAMAAARGWTGTQWTCLNNLFTRESGWRTTAGSPSGAYGIPQALPGSKMAAAGSDWRTNPATQIAWGLNYIKGRYGTPCGAWSSFTSRGWY